MYTLSSVSVIPPKCVHFVMRQFFERQNWMGGPHCSRGEINGVLRAVLLLPLTSTSHDALKSRISVVFNQELRRA